LVVTDAAKLGIVCSISDARCLQKILVLARVDELIAFEVSGKSLSIARITARTATFAKTRKRAGAAASARAAWAALERAAQVASHPPREEPRREEDEPDQVAREDQDNADDEEPGEDEERAPRPPPRSEETPTAITGGLTPTLLTAGVGAGAAVLFGAATLGVSAVVANQIRATERGVPLDASYDAMNTTFWILAGLTAASAATGVVAGALHLLDDGAAPEAVSGP